ncbi:hypothetical protein JOQ06_002695, partial [Pogonophryne albipinna]
HPSPLGFYYSLASRHTESHVKAGHRPPRLAGPFLPPAFRPVNAISSLPSCLIALSHSSFPSNYGSSHPESRGQRWTRLAAERLMAERGWRLGGGGRNAGTSGQITCLISRYVSSIGGVLSAA